GGIAHRRDDPGGIIFRAVLASTPGGISYLALGHGSGEFFFESAGPEVAKNKTMEDRFAQGFGSSKARQQFGACVPARDMAVLIQHADRVVGNAFDRQPKTLFAAIQGFLGSISPGMLVMFARVAGSLFHLQISEVSEVQC